MPQVRQQKYFRGKLLRVIVPIAIATNIQERQLSKLPQFRWNIAYMKTKLVSW